MNPSSDSPGPSRHGKRPLIQPSPSSSESSSSSSEQRRNAAAAAVEEEDESMAEQPECYVCGRRFKNLKGLSGHMKCHPERGWKGVRPVGEGEEEVSKGRRKRWRRRRRLQLEVAAAGGYACKECGKVFKTTQALGGHRASHSGVVGCSGKAKATTAEAAAADGGGGHERKVACPVCGRKFFTYHGMRVHQGFHRERSGGEVEGGKEEEKEYIVDLNLTPPPEVAEEEDKPPPEVAEEEDKQVGNEQGE